ncbi:TonB-dependent receptor [Zavarzinia aquatilis]|uniref:TonB-dependent siderophore receptor n=1 Tax=Zavarzinia aquatilis TaxID=2211142 RepID=A0A317E2B9_9PROT|nr:TonB-dependent receptor [Zavarzinia aquatilis]PWR20286.1 TonB-dependent siderophore receptor [Zavarzinia aquatilis]
MIEFSRPRVSHLAMLAVLAATPAYAGELVTADGDWSATATASAGQTAETLPTVTVTGAAPANNQKRATNLDRLPQEIQDTPQTVNVISEETLKQQGTSTLDQALRNVPGITVAVGEGNGGMNGDQFRIRGFDAKNDIYSDGLRDFGVYTRDTFNTEDIQVFIGPSGESFGRGTFGGAINTSSKTPKLDDFVTLRGEIGLGPHLRTTADANYKIDDTTAFRLNLMYADIDLVGRDVPGATRWGFAPSIAFGLGTDTTLSVSYFHQEEERVPDYGIPTMQTAVGSSVSKPADVDRSNWYGSNQDHDDTTADVVTVRAAHQVNEGFRITNDTRVGVYSREFLTTVPGCNGTACVDAFYGANPGSAIIAPGGGTPFYDLDNWGVQNITTGVIDFALGGFKNQAVFGLDASYESSHRVNYTGHTTGRPDISLTDPQRYDLPALGLATRGNDRESEATNVALFASDQFWITPELSVMGGLRWDNYSNEYDNLTVATNVLQSFSTDESLLNPKASLIWEPSKDQTYYFSWARSSEPAAGTSGVANLPNPIGSSQVAALDPVTSETFEVGAKFSLLDERLGLGVAVFQTERDNASTDDGVTITASGQSFRNRGVELSLSGQITPNWGVQAGYTYIHSEYLKAGADRVVNEMMDGERYVNVPEHAATLWTTYEVIDGLTFGGGVRYQSEVLAAHSYNTTTNSYTKTEIPYYLSVEGLVSYEIGDGVTIAANGYNLFDREDNFTQYQNGRAVPAAGRTVIFSTTATF